MCKDCFKNNRIKGTTTFSLDKGEYTIIISNAPCLRCLKCGEAFFTDEISANLEKMVEEIALKRSLPRKPLTDEQIAEIEAKAPKDEVIVFDEDCPPTHPEKLAEFHRPSRIRMVYNADIGG